MQLPLGTIKAMTRRYIISASIALMLSPTVARAHDEAARPAIERGESRFTMPDWCGSRPVQTRLDTVFVTGRGWCCRYGHFYVPASAQPTVRTMPIVSPSRNDSSVQPLQHRSSSNRSRSIFVRAQASPLHSPTTALRPEQLRRNLDNFVRGGSNQLNGYDKAMTF